MRAIHPTEEQEMMALAEWVFLHERKYPELKYLFHVPNGQLRHPIVAIKLKKQMVRPGVPDLFLPICRTGYAGLWIEMKRHGGKPSEAQKEWLHHLRVEGYWTEVCDSWEAAKDALVGYLGVKR